VLGKEQVQACPTVRMYILKICFACLLNLQKKKQKNTHTICNLFYTTVQRFEVFKK